ncbi:MAG: tail fiber domain-containing protein, partial [Bacteroidetes bacterium]|nr:tail fiber domain-containing protein [Bacteroidota bacterium]
TAELSLGIADGPGSFVTGSVAGDAVFRTNSGANNFLFASGGGGAPVTLAITPTSVGIGTTTPFAQLSNSTTNIYGTDGYGLSSSAFGWGSTDGFGYAAGFYNAGTGIASNGVTVKIQGSQGTVLDLSASDTVSVMTVKGNGNVGMGTTAPTSRLTVVSTPANIPAVNVLPVPGSARVNVAVGDWSLLQDYFGSGVSKDFSLYQNSKGLHRMLIDTAGNVGFGTTTPDRPLVVRSADNTLNSQVSELANGIGDANFHLVATKGATTNNPGDIMTRLGLAYGDNGASVDGSFIRFHRGIAGNDGSTSFSSGADVERMRITSSGRVGIGTTGPGGQFELSLDQGRKPLTNTWTIVSDARLKNIDGAYSKGLKEIMQLNPIAYHYKNVGERKFENEVLNTQAVGFTAQDVQKVFPEAVGTDADGYLNLNIHSIIIAQVNAIKELGAQNEVKDAKIAELQNENAAMHAELNDMKQCVESLCANNESKTQNSELKTENYLFQNQPNPFNQTTVISYQLLSDAKNASIVIRGLNGEELKSVSLSNTGKGQVTINANELAQGTYTYTLIVNGKSVDTKLMVVTR